ncbi:NAD-dependent epimerase/dehydratase family protein [Fictibacillus sp. WQ 8-8]|uniref:NAD-dependent epimerase/dehydratase family protein n=1 Tax=Fictibacillus sp. WQ 8-8 TaxID=2938788 RepID=UPI0021091AD6|nr:NAD-dependent epimerase/dehydratase family protein [Fictibacillus sp. WQ 8-8]MCQ6267558.1 NAD-dependent epimerase/dehydratase family protein [Fictibacillus sp. WQ 8-8]
MRVLVIGGTSFMGPEVIKRLFNLGHEVTVFHRGQTRTELPAGVHEMLGDRNDLSSFRSKIQELKPDAVLDMICLTERQAKTLVQTLDGIVNRVIVASSQDVYRAFGLVNGTEKGAIEPVPIDENGVLRHNLYPHREFAKTEERRNYDKILVERVVMNAPGIEGTIIRLPAVYGPNDKQHRWYSFLKPMSDQRPYILLSESLAGWRWTRGYVENMAEGILQAVLNDQAKGKIYNLGENEAFTMKEWVKKLATSLQWKGKIVVLPDSKLTETYSWGINAEQDVIFTSDKIRSELGFTETVSLEDGLKRTIDWELKNPPETHGLDYEAEDEIMRLHHAKTQP